MIETGYTLLKACFRLDKRCLLGIVILFLFSANFLVLIFYNVEHVDPRNTLIYLFPDAKQDTDGTSTDNWWDAASLPSFTWDRRDMILGAIIERSYTSASLSLTVIALNRNILKGTCRGACPSRLSPKAENLWRDLATYPPDEYGPDGKRLTSGFRCKLSSADGVALWSSALFIANTHAKESGANSRLDIFRCPLPHTAQAYRAFIRSNESLHVSLARPCSLIPANTTCPDDIILTFSVPWASRRTGFMLSANTPSASHAPDALVSSRFDPWAGFAGSLPATRTTSFPASPVTPSDIAVYMCITLTIDPLFAPMAGAAAAPSVPNIAQLLEFLQHHVLLGMSHIFVAVRYAPLSDDMRTLLLALRYFIEAGLVSVVTQSTDNIDRTSSIFGLSWTAHFLTLYHRTATLLLLKGLHGATSRSRWAYLAMWGQDGMLVPDRHMLGGDRAKSVQDVILSWSLAPPLAPNAEASSANHMRGKARGATNGVKVNEANVRLPCHLILRSKKIIERFPGGAVDPRGPWLSDRFSLGKSFVLDSIPPSGMDESAWARRAYGAYSSLHPEQDMGLIVSVDGALQPVVLNDHSELSCTALLHRGLLPRSHSPDDHEDIFPSSYGHGVDEGKVSMMEGSGRWVAPAVIYRYMAKTFRYDNDSYTPVAMTYRHGDYVTRHAEGVMQRLRSQNLDLMVLVGLSEQTHVKGVAEEHWPMYVSAET